MLELKYKPYYASYSAVLDDLVTGNPMFEQLEYLPTISVIPEREETMDGLRDVLDSIEGASVQAEGEHTNSRAPAAVFQKSGQNCNQYTVVQVLCLCRTKLSFTICCFGNCVSYMSFDVEINTVLLRFQLREFRKIGILPSITQ